MTGVDADAKIAESMDLQAAAERKRRETVKSAQAEKEAVILESEGQRERDKNESDGQRIRAITEAQGFSEQQVLRAEGLRKAKMLEAEGIAFALEKIGRATESESGQRALQFLFGSEYVKYMSALGSKSNSTIFLGQDVGDMSAMLAKGLSLMGSNAFRGPVTTTTSSNDSSSSHTAHSSPSFHSPSPSSSSSSSSLSSPVSFSQFESNVFDENLSSSKPMGSSSISSVDDESSHQRQIEELKRELESLGVVHKKH